MFVVTFYWKRLRHFEDSNNENKTEMNVRATQQWDTFVQPLLQWKSNEYYVIWACVFVDLVTQHALRMRHIVICGRSDYTIFLHPIIGTILEKKKLPDIKCVFWFFLQLLSEKIPILRRTERDIIINVHRSSCKVPVILARFWWNLNFSMDIRKIHKYSEFNQNPSSEGGVVPNG